MPHSLPEVPESARYVHALTVLEDRITQTQRALLVAHWLFPRHVATAPKLARATGLSGYRAVNSHYGRLGKLLRDEMNYHESGLQSYVIAWFERLRRAGAHWELHMHPELADALRQLGWVRHVATPKRREKHNGNVGITGQRMGDSNGVGK